ncbi:MAG: hypothetical protein R3185_06405, partial [Candidatus Thermoplasmatota archaeon]|nr:hypothetical protein [Candidatus Thermoplasmatota archaeon]
MSGHQGHLPASPDALLPRSGCLRDQGTKDPLARTCYTGPDGTLDVGLCTGGTQTCTEGAYGVCAGEVTPSG